jgi:hypothetical protein
MAGPVTLAGRRHEVLLGGVVGSAMRPHRRGT